MHKVVIERGFSNTSSPLPCFIMMLLCCRFFQRIVQRFVLCLAHSFQCFETSSLLFCNRYAWYGIYSILLSQFLSSNFFKRTRKQKHGFHSISQSDHQRHITNLEFLIRAKNISFLTLHKLIIKYNIGLSCDHSTKSYLRGMGTNIF